MRTISVPRKRYHHDEKFPASKPNKEAAVPNTVKVIAIPKEKTTDNKNEVFGSFAFTPPTYPITKGTLDNAQGVIEVKTPARSAMSGAIH
jgi:hypothetical protein